MPGGPWGRNIYAKIIEKTLFFLSFFDILRKSLEAFGNALEGFLGMPGEPLGTPGEALGTPWEALGTFWEGLGDALGGPSGGTS